VFASNTSAHSCQVVSLSLPTEVPTDGGTMLRAAAAFSLSLFCSFFTMIDGGVDEQ
jgi:hypothetical protein